MPKRNKSGARAVLPRKPKSSTKKNSKSTPFADVGQVLGSAVGKMFNLNLGGAGRWLGSGIGSIFGSGDYSIAGPQPSENVLFNSAQIPKFSTTKTTNVVAHREYLGDIKGSTTVFNTALRINPADPATFPWLSTVAQSYTQYKIHGMIFEFKSLKTDFVTGGSPGFIALATNYNAREQKYRSKMELENSEYSASTKPTCNLVHGIECAVDQTSLPIKYLSPRAQESNPQDYDMGTFQYMVGAQPDTSVIGELWVSYVVEFFKPAIPDTVGGAVDGIMEARASVTSANPFGTVQLYRRSTVDSVACTGTGIALDLLNSAYYQVNITWQGSTVTTSLPAISLSNASFVPTYTPTVTGPTDNVLFAPASGLANIGTQAIMFTILTSADLSPVDPVVITCATGSTLPGNATCQILITKVDDVMFLG